MGTLFECLREARLEQYYSAFRANGITRSEMLSRLTLDECMAMGITSLEDKRRVTELINIIKSVHTANRSTIISSSRRNSESRRLNVSPAYALSLANYHALEVTRDVIVHDRTPNFSASSYIDILQLLSESSDSVSSEDSEHLEQLGYKVTRKNTNRSNSSVPQVKAVRAAVERVKHNKGYNYGVPHSVTKLKSNNSGAKLSSGDDRIRVCVRKRPLTRREIKSHDNDIVQADNATTVVVNEPKQAVDLTAFTLQHEFFFDEVFSETCTNEDVYLRAARPLISCLFNGVNATCFAYGQTGAGKTHTMMGTAEIPGLYLLAAQDIFSLMESGQYGTELHLWVSFFEIYCGQLFDLLNRRQRLKAREDGSHNVCIAGLMETNAKDVSALVQILDYGNAVRSKGATGVNPYSSRSHAILQMEIRDGADKKLGRISFIDLAGSERAADVTDTDKQTRMEGAEINQSLLALKECIRSIDQESPHKPFRQSKLTHILKDSFVGNSRTCMIANISPTYVACEHTLNTLRYADRVKELKRQSSPKGGSARQAMNLLLNIPITAPSLFHPSSILSTSTPMKAQTKSITRQHTFEDSLREPSVSPVRGHNVRRKTARAQSQQTRNVEQAFRVSPTRTTTLKLKSSPVSSVIQNVSVSARKIAGKTNVPVVSVIAHEMSSPSGSDRTDSESCNITLPKNGSIPVVDIPVTVASTQSIDTEFDFPTSDFNEAEQLNDLNKSDPPHHPVHIEPAISQGYFDAAIAASGHSVLATESSCASHSVTIQDTLVLKPVENDFGKIGSTNQKEMVPALKKPKRSNSPARRLPSLYLVQAGVTGDTAESVPSQANTMPYEIPHTTATTLSGSVDDDMLFDVPPPSKIPASAATIATTLEERNHLSIIPAALPASSSDLTQFTQRQRVVPPSDMEGILLTPRTPEKSVPLMPSETVSTSSATSHVYTSAKSVHFLLSPKNISIDNLPTVNVIPELPVELVTQSPMLERRGSVSKTPSPVQMSPTRDCKQRHTSASSTADSSDDSFEGTRISVSDSGQGPYKQHIRPDRAPLRKEKSDPILALHMQKKKHTLPNPEEFLKYLSRGTTPKSGSSPSIPSPMSGILTKCESQSEKASHLPQNKAEHFEPLSNVMSTDGDEKTSHLSKHLSKEKSVDLFSYNMQSLHKTGLHDRNILERQFSCDLSTVDTTESGSIPPPQSGSIPPPQSGSIPPPQSGSIPPPQSGSIPPPPPQSVSSQSVIPAKQKSNLTDKNRNQCEVRRFAHSPPECRANNRSPVIQMDKPNIPVLNETDGTLMDSDNLIKNVTVGSYVVRNNNSPYGGKSMNTAIVTEKLATGSVFSPIHPQPLTSVVVSKMVATNLDVIQPKPVTAASLSLTGTEERTSGEMEKLLNCRSQLISAHEDQLATVTSLCKHEMKLLLGAKAGNRSFEDYLRRVNDLLSQKLAVMRRLQDKITSYCEEKRIPAFSTSISQSSRTSVSQSVSRSSTVDQLTSRSINNTQSALNQRAQR